MQQNTPNTQIETRQAIQDLLTCQQVCAQTARADRQSSGSYAGESLVQMLEDCAELCQTTAHFLQHGSALAGYLCQTTAQVTTIFANEFEQMGDTDAANVCRSVAWSTNQLSKMVAE